MPTAERDDGLDAWISALQTVVLGADTAAGLHLADDAGAEPRALSPEELDGHQATAGWSVPLGDGHAVHVVLRDPARRDDAVAALQAVLLAVELRRRRQGLAPTAYSLAAYASVRRRVHAIRNSLNSLVMNAAVLSYEQRAAGNPFATRVDSDARDCSQGLTGLVGALEPGALTSESTTAANKDAPP